MFSYKYFNALTSNKESLATLSRASGNAVQISLPRAAHPQVVFCFIGNATQFSMKQKTRGVQSTPLKVRPQKIHYKLWAL